MAPWPRRPRPSPTSWRASGSPTRWGSTSSASGSTTRAPCPCRRRSRCSRRPVPRRRRIHLGSAVSVLGTDDPVRVYQQAATASAVSGGRVDLTVGRGSSVDSFPLFGYDVSDYDRLFVEKLDLLLAVNASERVTWSGTTRSPLDDAVVVPRVDGGLKIWLGTGGNPGSCVRAGVLGLPLAFGILSGRAEDWLARAAALPAGRRRVGPCGRKPGHRRRLTRLRGQGRPRRQGQVLPARERGLRRLRRRARWRRNTGP